MTDKEKWQIVCDEMLQSYPVLASVFVQAPSRFGATWYSQALPTFETMYDKVTQPLSKRFMEALEGYAEFANDSMRNQVFYEKTGHYRASDYKKILEQCYHSEEHMTRRYLPGMFLSHYVWPQHYHMLQGFVHGLLPRVSQGRLFFEVGVGCGLYSKATLEALPAMRGIGFDISSYALDFTDKLMAAFGLRERYKVENRDIKLGYNEACDFMICQEVLEHLEDPAEFCKWLFNMVRPGGHAYITAALNAAHSDHIYLFHKPAEVEDMVRAAGFQPLHSQEECAPGFKERNLTPSLCGFFCQRPA